ncbi:MAG: SURF1 family protein [Sphingomonadaceae bacterium]|nr:SURF1 family protein [Sphingomonadaceae bacterium]
MADSRPGCRRIVLTALLGLASILFAGLAIWQVERRSEKLALIEAVTQRLHAPPAAAPGPADWPQITSAGDAYRPVRIGGVFLHERETLVQAATGLGPGYWVLTPLRTEAGWTVLVNRGFVPADAPGRALRRAGEPTGPVTVTGLLRITEPGGAFLHANDPAHDRWYSRDVAAIAAARGLGTVAPYFIDAAAGQGDPHQPRGGLTVVSFPNNHLQYALTWAALAALSLFGIARTWCRKGER